MSDRVRRQGIRFFIILVVALAVAWFSQWIAGLLVFFVATWMMTAPVGRLFYSMMLRLFFLLLPLVILVFFIGNLHYFQLSALSILLGTLTGFLVKKVVMPEAASLPFQNSVASILKIYQAYFSQTINCILGLAEISIHDNYSMEMCWLAWPTWLKQRGFDLRLQVGCQYFVEKIMQMGEVLFSLHYLARDSFTPALREFLMEDMLAYRNAVDRVFTAIIEGLQVGGVVIEMAALANILEKIEKEFREIVPVAFAGLDLQHETIKVANVLCALEDLQWLLMKLTQALR